MSWRHTSYKPINLFIVSIIKVIGLTTQMCVVHGANTAPAICLALLSQTWYVRWSVFKIHYIYIYIHIFNGLESIIFWEKKRYTCNIVYTCNMYCNMNVIYAIYLWNVLVSYASMNFICSYLLPTSCFYFTRKDNKSTYIILYMLTNEFINLQHLSKITVFTLKKSL